MALADVWKVATPAGELAIQPQHGERARRGKLPPMVSIEGGTYLIGSQEYDDEKPPHTVDLAPFEIGAFPVTNAEYALFIAAGGYEDEQWWDTDEALAWLRGEGSTDGQKAGWRDTRATLTLPRFGGRPNCPLD